MKRLIFLYMSEGCAPPNSNTPWDPKTKSKNKYVGGLESEGYLYILKRLSETKVFDEIIIFIESNRGPGYFVTSTGIKGYVVPEIVRINEYLKPNDIIWARGGVRSWYEVLNKKKGKHWMMLYAANTGRQRWMFWDLVLNDTLGINMIDRRGRFFFNFKKPINPEIFKPIRTKQKYDICIGASYIHDKKGQWRVIEALIEYKKLYGENLKCIMPGAPRRGTHSNLINDKIQQHKLDVWKPAKHFPREELAVIMNQSKIFIHAGMSGENDRGPLEAMRCGCLVMIGSIKYHSPILYDAVAPTYVIDINNYTTMAIDLHHWVNNPFYDRKTVFRYYEEKAGIETVILPEMTNLFQLMQDNPVPNSEIFRGLCDG